jgi:hypothetical protein
MEHVFKADGGHTGEYSHLSMTESQEAARLKVLNSYSPLIRRIVEPSQQEISKYSRESVFKICRDLGVTDELTIQEAFSILMEVKKVLDPHLYFQTDRLEKYRGISIEPIPIFDIKAFSKRQTTFSYSSLLRVIKSRRAELDSRDLVQGYLKLIATCWDEHPFQRNNAADRLIVQLQAKAKKQQTLSNGQEFITVIEARDILQMDSLLPFEQCKRTRLKISEIAPGRVLFISHKWFGNEPDDEHNSLLAQLKTLIERQETKRQFWVDYCCVPQADNASKLKELAKIPALLRHCQLIVIESGPGYHESVWCLVEKSTDPLRHKAADPRRLTIKNIEDLDYLIRPLISSELLQFRAPNLEKLFNPVLFEVCVFYMRASLGIDLESQSPKIQPKACVVS